MVPKHHYVSTLLREGFFKNLMSFGELEHKIAGLSSNNERGDAFEVFAEAYLATQKIHQVAELWPAQTVPNDIQKTLGLPDTDQGVDGVFRTTSGELNAYQVKFRSGRPRLQWGAELSTFMGLSDQVDQRVLFTNCDDLPEVMNDRRDFYCIRGSDLDRLTKVDFEAITEWLATGHSKPSRYTPQPHQREALDAILGGLHHHDRATSVMACGTGKTLVALWLAEESDSKRIIVLLPSLALVRQTLHEWLRQTSWERMMFRCVCSDPTVTKGADNILVQQSDLDFRVNTNPVEVREFLAHDTDDVRVIFTTYQSAPVVAEAMNGVPSFDLGIFDEAHKTAGRQGTNFAFALSDENIPIGKRVFLTATPRHYDVRKKDKEGELKSVFSMDDVETFGPFVHTLAFAEAARLGIICDYKVIISVVTSDMIDDDLLKRGEVIIEGETVSARQVAHQIALQRACEEHDLRKVFTFHTTVKTAREFTGEGGASIASHLPNHSMFHVSGAMRTADREKRMDAFRDADRAVMSNARCLTEGVDVPAVDMVGFMAPKRSKVDIVQATGRAMRKSGDRTVGYVMVPLYVELGTGETIEEALERTDFGDIWDVLQAMQEQDDVLADIIRELKVEKGRTGGIDHNRIRERVEVLGPEVSTERLQRSIAAVLIDRLGVAWDERFGELEQYKAEHGDCKVPQGWPNSPKLGKWVQSQRSIYNKGELNSERIRRLEELGFAWDPLTAIWEARFGELKQYKAEHGDCDVSARWSNNLQLGIWVQSQRRIYNKGELNSERIKRLEELGFVWDPLTAIWEARFDELKQYKAEHNDCNVPEGWPENPKLAIWVAVQRRNRKSGKLEKERIRRLEKLGIVWDPLSGIWEASFDELKQYKAEHGDCDVSAGWSENPKLGRWVNSQRRAYKSGKLENERIRRLEKLGFVWDPLSAIWEASFGELKQYKVEHGDCDVPSGWPKNPSLGRWVSAQRKAYKTGKLEEERIKRLEELGFAWNPNTAIWEASFDELVQYKAEHGDCDVPSGWPKNPKLGRWVNSQRTAYKSGKLEKERIRRLEKLGFVWDPLSAIWEASFGELKQYKVEHGDCDVPSGWLKNPSLGRWVSAQRKAYKTGKLEEERIKRLEELGFAWDLLSGIWEASFGELVQYKAEHNDCNVPEGWPKNPSLGRWVNSQRRAYKSGKLENERIRRLEELGFVWDPLSGIWEASFDELKQYKAEHGDCDVSAGWPENPKLGRWVNSQRRAYKSGKLENERIRRLEELGFVWDPLTARWETRFGELKQYKAKHGDCDVPSGWPENPKLGKWVSHQRGNYNSDKLEEERIRQLEELGFLWRSDKLMR